MTKAVLDAMVKKALQEQFTRHEQLTRRESAPDRADGAADYEGKAALLQHTALAGPVKVGLFA